jgi:hypothetical protein
MPTFEITGRIDHLSDGVGCFDPVQVICRMRGFFPELIESSRDCLWETANSIRQLTSSGQGEGAYLTAVRDMQERGPKILFTIPLTDGRVVRGTAERYWVSAYFTEKFPEDFQRRFTEFLNSLFLQPIQVIVSGGE